MNVLIVELFESWYVKVSPGAVPWSVTQHFTNLGDISNCYLKYGQQGDVFSREVYVLNRLKRKELI